MPTEDPHLHLKLFIEVSDSFKLVGVLEDTLRLKLFTYSLRDKPEPECFLMKYFLYSKNVKLRNEITSFLKMDDESLYEAWERFKELLRKAPS
ncbi:reverse transcriptase [Gossypium australe]|uniref:Reverse transcriptase n=1 Tax=Gossypium australe TaxID=47621 RepID=A0A5B6WP30_9ROSI|nr:reverse transcriptase [Gossypium australe]